MLISSVKQPTTKKEKLFARAQEAVRKDIERAFGVLQVKWKIISRPSHFMTVKTMNTIMKCFIILHNMCVAERVALDMPEEEEEAYADDLKVRDGATPTWGVFFERLNGRSSPLQRGP